MQKRVLIIIGIIILIAIAVGGVFAYQYFAVKNSSQTADWKTYRNDEYRFEFSYPTGVSVQDNGNVVSVNDSRFGYNFEWDMKFYKNASKKELNEWISSQFDSFDQVSDKDCKIVPADKYGVRVNIKDAYTVLVDAPSIEASCSHVGYYTISSDGLIIMEFNSVQASDELYKDILSTFKFTE